MDKFLRILICLVGITMSTRKLEAQEAQSSEPELGWQKEMVGTLNLTQASFDNWQQGGESNLAWQLNLNTSFDLEQTTYSWTNAGKLNLGFTKIGGKEARKSADEIRIESVYTRKVSQVLNPFFSVTAQTQFVAGFEFDKDDNKTKISAFLDPGYFTQSVGVGFSPNKVFRTRLGATLKETIANDFSARFTDNPSTAKLEKSRIEPGISSVTNFKKKFQDNVIFASKLDIFSDLEAFDRTDVLWENNLTLKVAKYINVSINVDLFYDKDISEKRQLKQVLAVGFTYTFL